MTQTQIFVDLCKRSSFAFWAIIGKTPAGRYRRPSEISIALNDFQRMLAAYSRPLKGIDLPQERALAHLATAQSHLWRAFKHWECKMIKAPNADGEMYERCFKHGSKENCKGQFMTWYNKQRY